MEMFLCTILILLSLVITGLIIVLADLYFATQRKSEELDMAKKAIKLSPEIYKHLKLINLSPKELDDYMGTIFGYCLELSSIERVTEKDPDAPVRLYGNTLNSFMEYLGEENIKALDYHYGEGYLERWAQMRYRLLENRGQLNKIIHKQFDL